MNSSQPAQLSGILLIDKPAGITSFDCIRALRRQTGLKKIGHAGTLDPMATGLMIMLMGSATKRAEEFSKSDKSYKATMALGSTSTTGDADGEITKLSNVIPTQEELENAMERFKGDILQTPSAYSAIKVGGVRAYKLARAGKTLEMPPRSVTVQELNLLSYSYPEVLFEASVSSGTYIRSLAEDVGAALGTGAYLSALRRTRIGKYQVGAAKALDRVTKDNVHSLLLTQ